MTTLYTNGDFITLSPTQLNSYSSIRYSVDEPWQSVAIGFTASGTVDFSADRKSVV